MWAGRSPFVRCDDRHESEAHFVGKPRDRDQVAGGLMRYQYLSALGNPHVTPNKSPKFDPRGWDTIGGENRGLKFRLAVGP